MGATYCDSPNSMLYGAGAVGFKRVLAPPLDRNNILLDEDLFNFDAICCCIAAASITQA